LSTGTASDDASGVHPSGVKEVYVRIIRNSDGLYWRESTKEWIGTPTWNLAEGTAFWQISISTDAWTGLSGSSFTINSMAVDNVTEPSANSEVNISSKTFWIDNVPPESGLTKPEFSNISPPPVNYYSDITQITGTSSDDVSVAFTQISIKKYDSNNVWNGSTWISGAEYWIQSGGENVSPWTYTVSAGTSAWTSGERYEVKSRATDTCDYDPNVETTPDIKYFIFDNIAPETFVSLPEHDKGYDITYVENSKIQGTATDAASGVYPAGVSLVQIALQKSTGTTYSDSDDLYWWDGGSSTSSFTSATIVWHDATMLGGSPPQWELSIASTVWKSGRRYRAIARAIDKAPTNANIEDIFEVSRNDNRFAIDYQPPQSFFEKPQDGASYNASNNKLSQIYGTCIDDASGVDVSSITIYDIDATQYWNGTGWQAGQVWLTCGLSANGTAWWYSDVPGGGANWPSGHEFRITLKAMDKTGNVETAHYVQFTVDTNPPDTGVSAPQNNKFYSQLTTISGTCTDDFSGVDTSQVYIKLIDITNPSTYYYFDGAGAWVQDLTWLQVSVSTPNWSYTKAENIFRWKNGHTYAVVPRAKDNAQNTETTFSTTTFKYDKNTQETWDEYPGEPDSDVSSPASDTYYSASGNI